MNINYRRGASELEYRLAAKFGEYYAIWRDYYGFWHFGPPPPDDVPDVLLTSTGYLWRGHYYPRRLRLRKMKMPRQFWWEFWRPKRKTYPGDKFFEYLPEMDSHEIKWSGHKPEDHDPETIRLIRGE